MSETSRYTDHNKLNTYLKNVYERLGPILMELADKNTYTSSPLDTIEKPLIQHLQIYGLTLEVILEDVNLHAKVGRNGKIDGNFNFSSRQGKGLSKFVEKIREIHDLRLEQTFDYDESTNETQISYALRPRNFTPFHKDKNPNAKRGRPWPKKTNE